MEALMARARGTSGHHVAAVGVRCVLLLFTGWLAMEPRTVRAQAAPSKEYQIKAACLLNFARFIQWPKSTFAEPSAPIVVGVLGDDPFGEVLEQTFHDESVEGRRFVIKRSRQVEELKTCHLLFVSRSEKDRVPGILATLGTASVVTVGEIDGFAGRGGILNFYVESGKIRFEINAEAAERGGLTISSQLLKRAKIVGSVAGRSGR
jgi:hypothetical protein